MENLLLASESADAFFEGVIFWSGLGSLAMAAFGAIGLLRPNKMRFLLFLYPGGGRVIGGRPTARLGVRFVQWCMMGYLVYLGVFLLRWIPWTDDAGVTLMLLTFAMIFLGMTVGKIKDHEAPYG